MEISKSTEVARIPTDPIFRKKPTLPFLSQIAKCAIIGLSCLGFYYVMNWTNINTELPRWCKQIYSLGVMRKGSPLSMEKTRNQTQKFLNLTFNLCHPYLDIETYKKIRADFPSISSEGENRGEMIEFD